MCLSDYFSLCLVSPSAPNPLFDISLYRVSVCIYVCVRVVCVCAGKRRCTYVCLCLHVQLHHRSGAIFAEGQGFPGRPF